MSGQNGDLAQIYSGVQEISCAIYKPGNHEEALVSQIETGMAGRQKTLPSLLLWDERGHELFEAIGRSRYYYGRRADGEVLLDHAKQIADMLGSGGTLVELGAGSIPNTHLIIEELCRRGVEVNYVAHDICEATLAANLCRVEGWLQDAYPHNKVRLQKFVATYEDSLAWLRSKNLAESHSLVVMWLGNSLSHFSKHGFIDIMANLSDALSNRAGLVRRAIFSADGCTDTAAVGQCYDPPDGSSAAFVANAMQHANRLLGGNVFEADLWTTTMVARPQDSSIVWCLRSLANQTISVGKSTANVNLDELVEIISLRKRDEVEVSVCLRRAGARLVDIWRHSKLDWNIYVLDSTSPPKKAAEHL